VSAPLRVALLSPAPEPTIRELAENLRARGHGARVIAPNASGPAGAIESRLRRRGYLEHLTGRPFVLHYLGVGDHADLMARRRKLELVDAAARHAGVVVVTSDAAAQAFRRWLGVEARVIEPGADPEPWLELYAELIP
jgi:hypothetical protein